MATQSITTAAYTGKESHQGYLGWLSATDGCLGNVGIDGVTYYCQ